METVNDLNFEIRATQNAICNYECAIFNAGHNLNDVDKGYHGIVPESVVGEFRSKKKAKAHLRHLERYYDYLAKVIDDYPGARELT